MIVRTLSGSTYVVRNGRITRVAESPSELALKHVAILAEGRTFVSRTTPEIGRQWQFEVAGLHGPITTSLVVEIVR